MHLKHVASGMAALAMLGLASAAAPALARGHGHPGGGGWAPHHSAVRAFSDPRHFAPHHFRHHRRFAFFGAYPYDYVDDGCSWLRRRALYTGSPYWWHRYYACRHGYDY